AARAAVVVARCTGRVGVGLVQGGLEEGKVGVEEGVALGDRGRLWHVLADVGEQRLEGGVWVVRADRVGVGDNVVNVATAGQGLFDVAFFEVGRVLAHEGGGVAEGGVRLVLFGEQSLED